ncbi:MAG: efflux RND transporter periplasmic adaptor subunit [Armatimonadetes bacterium]|nr:efflux RND transporter periplasmic adaptor subunit [Armatimonadota bacterium]
MTDRESENRGISRRHPSIPGIVVLALLMGCARQAPPQEAPRKAVQAVAAREGVLEEWISLYGTLKARSQVSLYSRIEGRIQDVRAEEGDRVRKGDILITLETDDLKATVDQARAQMHAAEARLEQAALAFNLQVTGTDVALQTSRKGGQVAEETMKQARMALDQSERDLGRTELLFARGAASKQQLDVAQVQRDLARSRLEAALRQQEQASQQVRLSMAGERQDQIRKQDMAAAKALVEQSRAALLYAETQLNPGAIRSPLSGEVTYRNVEPGDTVTATSMTKTLPLMTVTNNKEIYFEAGVPETTTRALRKGAKAEVAVDAFPGSLFPGRITAWIGAVDPVSRTWRVKITLDNHPPALWTGQAARARVRTALYRGIIIPRQALLKRGQETWVALIVGNRAHLTPVRVAHQTEEKAVLASGVKRGDRVIAAGSERLAEGDPVTVKE